VAAGADAVTCSGDKLIGGPQAGLIVGRTELLARMNRDPLARALRCGSLVLATLQQVLRLHLLGEIEQIPPLRQLSISEGEIDSLAQFWAGQLRPLLPRGWRVDLAPAVTQVGGGTHPLLVLPSRALGLWAPGLSAEQLGEKLRGAALPVLGRPRGELVWLDVRSLQAGQGDRSDAQLLALIAQAASAAAADK
jgi:L-seryl-tRNA(Ser) seleniumtransferase